MSCSIWTILEYWNSSLNYLATWASGAEGGDDTAADLISFNAGISASGRLCLGSGKSRRYLVVVPVIGCIYPRLGLVA